VCLAFLVLESLSMKTYSLSRNSLRVALLAPAFALALAAPLSLAQTDQHAGHAADGPGHAANHVMNQRPFEDLVAGFEDPARDEWQKPAEVLAFLGDVQGKIVMDIGSGSGYFSFRLLEAGANLICADVDERFLNYIDERMARESLPASRMETRLVPYDSSTLKPGEADIVLIVDTYHHIENRVAYFAEVRAGLKPGGKLVVVDFFKRDDPVGPGVGMKMSEDVVMAELREAGYTEFNLDVERLPYQYLIEAR
jgi:predicted methyltransferase